MLRAAWGVALAASLLLSGCSVRLISDYDEQLDQGVTALQKKNEAILTKIEKSKANPSKSYDAKDYEEMKEALNVIRVRAESFEKNRLTVNQLYLLGYALFSDPAMPTPDSPGPQGDGTGSLQTRHQLKEKLEAQDLQALRQITDVRYRAILKLELGKKRGE